MTVSIVIGITLSKWTKVKSGFAVLHSLKAHKNWILNHLKLCPSETYTYKAFLIKRHPHLTTVTHGGWPNSASAFTAKHA